MVLPHCGRKSMQNIADTRLAYCLNIGQPKQFRQKSSNDNSSLFMFSWTIFDRFGRFWTLTINGGRRSWRQRVPWWNVTPTPPGYERLVEGLNPCHAHHSFSPSFGDAYRSTDVTIVLATVPTSMTTSPTMRLLLLLYWSILPASPYSNLTRRSKRFLRSNNVTLIFKELL